MTSQVSYAANPARSWSTCIGSTRNTTFFSWIMYNNQHNNNYNIAQPSSHDDWTWGEQFASHQTKAYLNKSSLDRLTTTKRQCSWSHVYLLIGPTRFHHGVRVMDVRRMIRRTWHLPVLPDPGNIGVVVVISLLSCILSILSVLSYLIHVEHTITNVSSWMSSNFLSLNPSNTEFLIFGLPQQLSKLNNLTNYLPNNVILSPVDCAGNLGVIFDKNLSFVQHISSISNTCFLNIFSWPKTYS